MYIYDNTGLFVSPSGISDLCSTVTGMVTLKGSMLTEGEILQFSVLPYRCSICPPLVTRQMSNLAILADSKTQNASLFAVHTMFRHDCPLTVKLPSMQWNLKKKENLERFCAYWCVPLCCVCLGCCAAEFGSSGGTYELPCIWLNASSNEKCFWQEFYRKSKLCSLTLNLLTWRIWWAPNNASRWDLTRHLTFKSLAVSLLTTRFNIQNFYVVLALR
jgi:hypothetical protein